MLLGAVSVISVTDFLVKAVGGRSVADFLSVIRGSRCCKCDCCFDVVVQAVTHISAFNGSIIFK